MRTLIIAVCHATDLRVPNGIRPIGSTTTTNSADDLALVLRGLSWYQVCDACESLYDALTGSKEEFLIGLNQTFARNHFGYEMRSGQIERVGALMHDTAIEEARAILRDPDLGGPDQQFQKAIAFFNQRPVPDSANAVKEAVGAVEGLARILLDDSNLMLSAACNRMRQSHGTHPALAEMINKLYGYRGDAEGAAHGATGNRPIPPEEAELVIGVSASVIVYLARIFGRAIQ